MHKKPTEFPSGTLQLIQMTDTHLFSDGNKKLLGVNTLDSCREVIKKAKNDDWSFDFMLATGDLAHDDGSICYKTVANELHALEIPVYSLPGNHDHTEAMKPAFNEYHINLQFDLETEHWHLIFLDSIIEDSEGGHLKAKTLERLKSVLDNSTKRNILISLHHQPLAINCAWLDTMKVDNGDAFLELIEQYETVKVVVWGHIHQDFTATRKHIKLMSTPSTCIQFKPNSDDFALDAIPPGYRRIALQPNGDIYSDVIRIDQLPEGADTESTGY